MKYSITGHLQVKEFFRKILNGEESCPSALLLHGPRGIGKKTLFHEYSLNYFCRKGKDGYCGVCHTCKLISRKSFPDIYYLTGEGTIKIQQVRDLKDYFITPPVESKIKFVFIPEMENMTVNASNSFLKMLEEPPSYLKIVATSNHSGRILPTIRSRLMQISMTALTWDDFQSFCRENLPEISSTHYRLLSYLTHSSPGIALQISQNNAILTIRERCLEGIGSYCTDGDMSKLYRALDQSIKLQVGEHFFPLLILLFRDILYARMELKEMIVNRDIYDTIHGFQMDEGPAFLWELTDVLSGNLSEKKRFYDQFLWNEYYLWNLMKFKVHQ